MVCINKIRIGIAGYGNLGRGTELAVIQNPDCELTCVFTRRNPSGLKILTENVPVYSLSDASLHIDKADVLILCGGSRRDLPEQGPALAKHFNTVDSFDTHAKIPGYFDAVDEAARTGGKVSIISAGWDPGMFSIMRAYGEAFLPSGKTYTFWGKGVSQGHSDAIRRIEGVLDAKQYTVPVEAAVNAVRSGSDPELSVREKHIRECFVAAKPGADKAAIENDIKTMPDYFAGYDTVVHFISMEELERDHAGIPHGGFVIRSGRTGVDLSSQHISEYSIKLDSNPEFTSSVLVAYARAAYRLSGEGLSGAKTVLDIPPAYLSPKSGGELRKELL